MNGHHPGRVLPKLKSVAGALCLLFSLAPLGAVAADIPKIASPVLFTSLGQSPDAKTFSILAGRAKLQGEYSTLATGKEVGASKTVFITVGTSLKGFGSAGVNLDSEIARGEELVKAAKAAGEAAGHGHRRPEQHADHDESRDACHAIERGQVVWQGDSSALQADHGIWQRYLGL